MEAVGATSGRPQGCRDGATTTHEDILVWITVRRSCTTSVTSVPGSSQRASLSACAKQTSSRATHLSHILPWTYHTARLLSIDFRFESARDFFCDFTDGSCEFVDRPPPLSTSSPQFSIYLSSSFILLQIISAVGRVTWCITLGCLRRGAAENIGTQEGGSDRRVEKMS